MINRPIVEKPVQRSRIRRLLGREFYILRRKVRWIRYRSLYVAGPGTGKSAKAETPHILVSHKSLMLRLLKDVDMQLQYNKVENLRLAIARIDGTVIGPGRKFSVWKLVGRPTRRKGYLDGLVIRNGFISKGTGGGLCQLANLLYWMSLHTELDVTERWRHSFDVFPDVSRTVPFACGATLGYNYLDLEITNNTPDTFRIRLWQDGEYLYGEILCDRQSSHTYEVFETDHAVVQQWWGGYTRHNRIWKRRTHADTGEEELMPVSENHAIMMYNPLLSETASR